jgi:hypothetical protein
LPFSRLEFEPGCFQTVVGCLKWGAVGFVVAFALMKLYEASHIHDDIPKPEFQNPAIETGSSHPIDFRGDAFRPRLVARAKLD